MIVKVHELENKCEELGKNAYGLDMENRVLKGMVE